MLAPMLETKFADYDKRFAVLESRFQSEASISMKPPPNPFRIPNLLPSSDARRCIHDYVDQAGSVIYIPASLQSNIYPSSARNEDRLLGLETTGQDSTNSEPWSGQKETVSRSLEVVLKEHQESFKWICDQHVRNMGSLVKRTTFSGNVSPASSPNRPYVMSKVSSAQLLGSRISSPELVRHSLIQSPVHPEN